MLPLNDNVLVSYDSCEQKNGNLTLIFARAKNM